MTFELAELLQTKIITKDTDADIIILAIKTMYLNHKPKNPEIKISFKQIKFVSAVFLSKLFYWFYENKYLKFSEESELFSLTKNMILDTARIEYFYQTQIENITQEIDKYDQLINPRTDREKIQIR